MPKVSFAVLVGSQVDGRASASSDWDIALAFEYGLDPIKRYEQLGDLQVQLAAAMQLHPEQIDLIDIAQAGLTMREQIANTGLLLKGDNTLAWSHFLNRTWRELEMFHWEKQDAAGRISS
ncbi:nucleotidyltransferase domain-containing protein [Iodobacter sp. CM08]|uniref:type VII toxin-antitoxin system MntA family adenylyltransferase antitoxin n=1 Tax=Iodobacter sp. CM08 TaxID=3085902 RepID=UPI002982A208|nr:nucleotidyltransferase domain-containing protein [Iodobacter sp. CM08]MDW5416979.1 nucleotidyltransferase domain-containing protein [Iodobacter sp. CM08]